MNPVKQKMASFLIEEINRKMATISPKSIYAMELRKIEDVDTAIAEDISRICDTARSVTTAKHRP